MNGGEHFIPTVGLVDGFCKKTNTVYKFQGCFWHGCRHCYTEDQINPVNQRDMFELRKETERKNQCICDLGYTFVDIRVTSYKKIMRLKNSVKQTLLIL